MASSEHIAQAKAITDALTTLNTKLNETSTNYLKLVDTIKVGSKTIQDNAMSFENLKKAQKETQQSSQNLDKLGKQLVTSQEKLKQVEDKRFKQLVKNRLETQKATKEIKQNVAATNALKGSYDQINVSLNKNIARFKAMSKEQRENTKEGKALTATIQRQDKELKKLDSSIGRSQRGVGNYTGAIVASSKSLLGAFGLVVGVAAFARVLTNSLGKIVRFEKAQSELAAVLRTNTDGIEELTKSSLKYGLTTKFTATQVSGLQKELAKLGFQQSEILASTEAVLDLAAATESDLALAAKVTGSALRAFNLDASESERVASTLAVATTRSALTFQDYEDALANVAPVAKAYNFSIEDTVALLGTLKDAGFQANKASVATRNILLNLADSGGKLAKALGGGVSSFEELIPALIELREEGISLSETLDLTDKRSVAAFNRFLEGAESAEKLKDNITDVTDELDEMVKTRLDNLAGDVTLLSSAWERFVLKASEGTGVLRTVVRTLKDVIIEVANLDLILTKELDPEEATRYFDVLLAQSSDQAKALQEAVKIAEKSTIGEILLSEKRKDAFLAELEQVEFNRGKALALWDAYVLRRIEQDEQEVEAREAAEQANLDAEDKARKEREAAQDKADKETLKKEEKRRKKELDLLIKSLSEQEAAIRDSEKKKKTFIDEAEAELEADTLAALDKDISLEKARADAAIRERVRQFEQEKLLIEGSSKTEAEAQKGISDLTKKFINEDILALENLLANTEMDKEQRISIEQEIADKKLELNQIVADDEKLKDEERKKRNEALAGELIGITNKIFEVSNLNAEAESERVRQDQESKLTNIEQLKEQGLISEEEFSQRKEAIDKDTARREGAIQLKQAKNQKTQAIFGAVVSTAQGIAKTIGNLGFPLAIPFIAIAAALGAAQVAAISAKPLPKPPSFHKGTQSAPGTGFIAGDSVTGGAARELMTLRTGQSFMVNEPTYFEGSRFKGATIKTNRETEAIMRNAEIRNNINFDTTGLRDEMRAIRKAINEKPVMLVDRDARPIGIQRGNFKTVILNKLVDG